MDFSALSSGYGLGHLHGIVRTLQNYASFIEENATGFGKPYGFCIAVEKRDTKLIL